MRSSVIQSIFNFDNCVIIFTILCDIGFDVPINIYTGHIRKVLLEAESKITVLSHQDITNQEHSYDTIPVLEYMSHSFSKGPTSWCPGELYQAPYLHCRPMSFN